jgi:ATP-dependent Clp protease protease subunit
MYHPKNLCQEKCSALKREDVRLKREDVSDQVQWSSFRDCMTERMHQKRHIFITGRIDAHVSQLVVAQLIDLKTRSLDPICIYINSPGGEVTSGFGIYDFIEYVKKEIVVDTICYGEALGTASLIVAVGTPGHRIALRNSRLMIHQPWSGEIQGKVSDIVIQAKEMQNQKDILIGLYAINVNRPVDEIANNFEHDYYMNPEQALNFGLIDKIL